MAAERRDIAKPSKPSGSQQKVVPTENENFPYAVLISDSGALTIPHVVQPYQLLRGHLRSGGVPPPLKKDRIKRRRKEGRKSKEKKDEGERGEERERKIIVIK